ncbi:MAG: hypothetical protein ACRD7E_29195, partial [Bryobacteraceae bacterium]
MQRSNASIAAAIFVVMAAVLLFFHGQRIVLTNDEGIILEAAQRMSEGQRLYADFFGYMSPGSYWLHSGVYRIAGVALWTGRMIVILDFAVQCALVFWLTMRFSSSNAAAASRNAAVAAVAAFAGFQIADPSLLTATHRWDSATLALAALCLAVRSVRPSWRGWSWAAVGALEAAAAWCTPSMALVAAVTFAWIVLSRERRRFALPLLGGGAVIGVLGVGILAVNGSLAGFLEQMAWLSRNYSAVNIMPYGSVIGGYAALFEGGSGALDLGVRAILVLGIALPAIVPAAAILLWAGALWRGNVPQENRAPVLLLLAAVGALVITTLPRSDVAHLAFVAAIPAALTAAGIALMMP